MLRNSYRFLNFFETGQFKMYFGPQNILLHGRMNPITRLQCPILQSTFSETMEFTRVSTANIPSLFGLYTLCLCVCLLVFLSELIYKRLFKSKIHPQANILNRNHDLAIDFEEILISGLHYHCKRHSI